MKKLLLISMILYLASFSGAAMTFDTISIREVSVTAKRSIEERGISLTIIDSSMICSYHGGSLSELLASSSTVFMKTYGQGALSSISFRGTAASHTKVTWNGVTLNNPMLGQVDFSLVPVHFTDKITLLHGGSSLQDGSGALGGSINLESSAAWNDTQIAKLSQGFGSFGTYKSHASFQLGQDLVRWRMKLFYERSDNNFEYLNSENGRWNYEQQVNADYQKYGLLGEVFIKPDDNHIFSLHTWIQNSNRNIPAIMSYEGIGRTETQADDQLRVSGIWKNYGQKYRSEMTLGYSSSGIEYHLANQTGMGLFINYNSISKAQKALASYKISADIGTRTVLKSQVDYNYSRARISEEESFQGYSADRQEFGLGVSLHRQLGQYLTTFGLLRTEIADQKILPLMPSVGMEVIIPRLNLKVISNISRNYSLPTLNDLYWIPGGNPELLPEEGYTGDISLSHSMTKYGNVGLSMTLTGFASAINNWILWRPGEYSYWTAENIANVYARGLEYSMSGLYRPGELSLSFLGTYSYTRTTNRTAIYFGDLSVDQQLIYIPVHKANASMKADYKKFHLMSSVSYIGKRFTTSSNEETRHTLPGYVLFDVRAGKDINFKKFNTAVHLKINNLFNTDYKAILSRPMPGRSWEVVIRVEI
ncbi:TonB-dependent receptor [Bacteroidota bacterium]